MTPVFSWSECVISPVLNCFYLLEGGALFFCVFCVRLNGLGLVVCLCNVFVFFLVVEFCCCDTWMF